ncbi:MAG: TlpA family protein disulfide reductase [Candidatus Aminicenantales bacterium]
MDKRLIILLIGAVLLSGAACAAGSPSRDSGTPAPSFSVTDLDGHEWSLSSLRGKIIVVNFWATWCPPCRAEIPDFISFYNENKSKGLAILGLSVDEVSAETLKGFVGRNHMTYPVALAGKSLVRDFDMGQYIPTTFIIDKKGIIRHKQVGAMDKATLADLFDRLSKE